jgi:hypothetical protein
MGIFILVASSANIEEMEPADLLGSLCLLTGALPLVLMLFAWHAGEEHGKERWQGTMLGAEDMRPDRAYEVCGVGKERIALFLSREGDYVSRWYGLPAPPNGLADVPPRFRFRYGYPDMYEPAEIIELVP